MIRILLYPNWYWFQIRIATDTLSVRGLFIHEATIDVNNQTNKPKEAETPGENFCFPNSTETWGFGKIRRWNNRDYTWTWYLLEWDIWSPKKVFLAWNFISTVWCSIRENNSKFYPLYFVLLCQTLNKNIPLYSLYWILPIIPYSQNKKKMTNIRFE